MARPVPSTLQPMEAEHAGEIPVGEEWQYEPKWDGFRCLVHREGRDVQLRSKAGKPLGRYFPDVIESMRALGAGPFVLDGEIVIPVEGRLSFDALLLRIHPAESRVRKLAAESPAVFMAFDLLADGRRGLVDEPLRVRRPALEAFAARVFERDGPVRLSPATTDPEVARGWLEDATTDLDGVIAKRLDLPYAAGERSAMVKVKRLRSADCVVGGFRYGTGSKEVGSLLLGLYDEEGVLHHVGFTSGIERSGRAALTARLEKLRKPPGFTGRAPGGPSRWSTERSTEWEPLAPRLVAEVRYDHFTGGRFRHGTKFLRWRPDKDPRQCTFGQVERRGALALATMLGARGPARHPRRAPVSGPGRGARAARTPRASRRSGTRGRA